jgi:carboxyl-terminal processing protease
VNKLARTLGLSALAFLGGAAATLVDAVPAAHATSQDESPYGAMAQLGRVLVTVENEYVEPVDRAKMVNGAIQGMVSGLDPHSSYMPPDDFALFQSDTEGEFGGVGIEVDARNDVITVLSPIEGSPAERAGILSGDKLVAVDGETASAIGLEKMVRKMRGRAGSRVKLTLKRDGVKEPLTFDITREIIKVPSVASRMLKGDVAYIRIKQFQDKTHDELIRAVARLRAESKGKIAGVVLDMRNNPGGLVYEAADVADEFLSAGTIYTARHRDQVVEQVSAHGGGALVDLPTAVLVNAFTASAAELVTGALQDAKKAKVVGSQTFGKGSVQTIFELPGGAGMRLTTERYYTPAGHAVQAEGIRPDVMVSAEDTTIPLVRERDLEGHLEGEGSGAEPAKGAIVIDAGPPTLDEEEEEARAGQGSVARVPVDPEKGTDQVLKVGYAIVTKH